DSSAVLRLTVLQVRALLQLGRNDEAKSLMADPPSHDIAFLSARSGPMDLLWAQVHLIEGDLPGARMALRAAIEGLEYWKKTTQRASDRAGAEYAISRVGTPDEADDQHERFGALPFPGLYHDARRALVLRAAARAIRTSDPSYLSELRWILAEAEGDGAAAFV